MFKVSSGGAISVVFELPNPIGGAAPRAVDAAGDIYMELATNQDTSLFEILPDGNVNTIYDFGYAAPYGMLLLEQSGSILGAIVAEGSSPGELVRITKQGKLVILATIQGFHPTSLIEDDGGDIYGSDYPYTNYGNIFEFTSEGAYSSLYSFKGPPEDGFGPYSITVDEQGDLIGATTQGGKFGSKGVHSGFGTIYRVSPVGGELLSVPMNKHVGENPSGKLVPDGHGNYLGTAGNGAKDAPCGSIFELTAAGHIHPVYTFAGSKDGCRPLPTLAPDGHGGFYGMTGFGGPGGYGTVFEFTP